MTAAIEPANFFAMRTPLLSTTARKKLVPDEGSLDQQVQAIRGTAVAEAIFLSSQSLYSRLFLEGARDNAAKLALGRYLRRMSTRCTPFGISAAMSIGDVATVSALRVNTADGERRICRIDQGVIQRVIGDLKAAIPSHLEADTRVSASLNSSAWESASGIRYVELVREGSVSRYRLSRVGATPAIQAIIKIFENGPCNLAEAAAQAARLFDSTPVDAMQFLRSLLDAGLLTLEPQIHVASDNSMHSLAVRIADLTWAGTCRDLLTAATAELEEVTSEPQDNIDHYTRLAELFEDAGYGGDGSRLIHVDLHREGGGLTLSRAAMKIIGQEIWQARGLLTHKNNDLTRFAQTFVGRYGDAQVPLLEALDEDFGIGFGNTGTPVQPLLGGVHLDQPTSGELSVSRRDILLLQMISEPGCLSRKEIEVSELARLYSEGAVTMPTNFSVLGSLRAPSMASIDGGEFLFETRSFSSAPAMGLFGRFCCGSPELTTLARAFIQANESDDDDVVVAEVAHLPHGRVGNVNLRPSLRDYEITYLSSSERPDKYQIPAKEIQVSVRSGQVSLFSPRLGKLVRPRITSAHNHAHPANLTVYRFLGAMQRQEEPSLGWSWGPVLSQLPFLPRVKCGKLVLCRARWRLDTKTLKSGRQRAELLALLESRGVPRRIRIVEHDNFLELDLDNGSDIDLFVEECRNGSELLLEECFDDEELATDASGVPYKHELALPFITRQILPSDTGRADELRREGTVGRRTPHIPGGHWLYAQVFAGPDVLDDLVATAIPSLFHSAKAEGASRAFFIRYNEGGQHLRIRISGSPALLWSTVMTNIQDLLRDRIESGAIYKLRFDTYLPETNRYGGADLLPECEFIFDVDSETTAGAIGLMRQGPEREELRWRFAFMSMTALLRDFAPDKADQERLAKRFAATFSAEFKMGKPQNEMMKARYRSYREFFDSALEAGGPDVLFPPFQDLIESRSRKIQGTANGLRNALKSPEYEDLIGSLVHMCANRIFLENSRAHEAVIWHMAEKAMRSVTAKVKYQGAV